MIAPIETLETLFPRQTAFASISRGEDLPALLYENWQLESISGTTLSCLGAMPGIAHHAVASEVAFDYFRMAGLEPPSRLETYGSHEEAVSIASRMTQEGLRLASIYPSLREIRSLDKSLVAPEIYDHVNDKRNLASLCPAAFVPSRKIFSLDETEKLQGNAFQFPAFVKGALAGANGGGRDIFYCRTEQDFDAALQWFQSKPFFTGLVVEDPIAVRSNWCLNFSILDNDIRYIGAAEQVFEAVAKQSGSIIDPQNPPPRQAIEVGQDICRAAQAMGFRGIAGMDMCIDGAGKIYFFDLNFRINSCTCLILLHAGLMRDAPGNARPISSMHTFFMPGRLSDLMMPLDEMIQQGEFFPLQLYDGSMFDGPPAPCRIAGIFRSTTRAEGKAMIEQARACLSNASRDLSIGAR